jgi:hypothetical protein
MQIQLTLALLLAGPALVAQQALTVPAAYDTTDAPSRLWVAGFTVDLRQQIIIDAQHLQPMVGRTITALLWRRDADSEAFTGGTATMTVRLSPTFVDSRSASPSFAVNVPIPTEVFSDTVTVPASPPSPGPSASWAPDRTVRIAFTRPFTYSGGNLAIDVVGNIDPAQPIEWWPADAAWDYATGAAQSVGIGCGVHTNQNGEWASAAASTLLPGGMALLTARGTVNGLAFAFVGAPAQLPGVPLGTFLPGAPPSCSAYLSPPVTLFVTTFAYAPFPTEGGTAVLTFPVPNHPSVLGATLGCQWMDVQQQFATSNAVNFTIASTAPSLGMCVVQGLASSGTGFVLPNEAHVLRFEYQ